MEWHRRLLPMLMLLTALMAGCSAAKKPLSTEERQAQQAAALASQHGISVLALRRTADGYMLDFRYQVLDPQRSRAIFSHQDKPYLIHEASGRKFAVPSSGKVGPLRQMPRDPEAGRNYFMFFANPAKFVQSGDLVTVVIGEIRLEHLKVE